jgi:hypothetical protein
MSSSKIERAARGCSRVAVSCVFGLIAMTGTAQSEPTRKIVGLGATTCQRFNTDIAANPSSRRDYLAWAQGYMSGILLGRPAGVDDGLDLDPPTLGLLDQLKFLESFCASGASMDYSDAVEALYKRLRREGKS